MRTNRRQFFSPMSFPKKKKCVQKIYHYKQVLILLLEMNRNLQKSRDDPPMLSFVTCNHQESPKAHLCLQEGWCLMLVGNLLQAARLPPVLKRGGLFSL